MLTKFSFAVAIAAALLAMPAFGQITTLPALPATPGRSRPESASPPPLHQAQQPLSALSTQIPNTVHEGGHKYLGRDPDPEVRYQIMKDEAMHKGNSY